jgi:hypothetical protein
MIGLRDAAAFQGKLIEFQSKIIDANNAAFSAQDERTTLLERIHELEKEVADFKAWEAEKQRYQLVALAPNVVAYAIKEAVRGTEPQHLICANCYNSGKKSFLNQTAQGSRIDIFHCNSCDERLVINKGSDTPRSAAPGTRYDPYGRMNR